MRHSRRIRRAREEGWVGVREQAKERARENECFSLSLATVGGVRLQPVVFSLTHTQTHTSVFRSFFSSLACHPFGPRGAFWHFSPKWFFLLLRARWRLRFKDKRKEARQRKKQLQRRTEDIRKRESDWDGERKRGWSPSVLAACPGSPGSTPFTAVRTSPPSLYSSPLITSHFSVRFTSPCFALHPPLLYLIRCPFVLQPQRSAHREHFAFSGLPISVHYYGCL